MFQLYVELNNGDRKSFIFKSLKKANKIKDIGCLGLALSKLIKLNYIYLYL